ncbi:MAG: hypothetical protein II453_17025 [Alphaproteobacteria bacterium]|jgi:hypothetical protein|nr:hypothetical protein [Alphaproteobacteria bacterium]MBQ3946655.1 hypothetical protein [Alphaproteobacteria bacterium]
MRTAKIVSISSSDQVGLYSICFNNGESEFRKFLKKFKDNAALNKDYQSILYALDRIIAKGAFERMFRYEGKMNDNVVALSLDSKKLRLYCLRMSDQILIVGNGGVKETRTYDEDEELSGYVMDLQKFDELLKQAQEEGSIYIEQNMITGIEEMTFRV